MRHLSEIANIFKILTKSGEPDIINVYNAILSYSNSNQFILLETEQYLFDSVYQEIIDTREILSGDKFIFKDFNKNNYVPISNPGDAYVYFLFCSGQLVYIGQTKNLLSRIAYHTQSKDFDEMCCFNVDKDKLSLIEFLNINYYNPILNIVKAENIKLLSIVLERCCFE